MLAELKRRLAEHTPESQLQIVAERVLALEGRMELLGEARLTAMQNRLMAVSVRIGAAGPEKTLQRGYAMIRQDGQTVSETDGLDLEHSFTVILRDGWINAQPTGKGKVREGQP